MSIALSTSAAPIVSVLLPVYNAEPYLREAVESVLSQSFADFELVVINDGSTDNSLPILRGYGEKDPRVRVVTRENRGITATLNELIGLARGKYAARMDADDISEPGRLGRQVEFLENFMSHVAVGTWFTLISDVGPIGTVVKHPRAHEEIEKQLLSGCTAICHPTSMVRLDAYRAVSGYRPEFEAAEDLDLWLRLSEVGRLANIQDVLLQYRLHRNSVSERLGQKQFDAAKRACESAWKRRGIKGNFAGDKWYRPNPSSRTSRHQFALRYGWAAWSNRHYRTFRAFALEALVLRPFAKATWKLIIFGFLRQPPANPGNNGRPAI